MTMSLLKNAGAINTTTYEVSPDAIKQLIAADLNVKVEQLNVHFVIEEVGGDPMDRFRGTDTVTKIRVTVKS